MASPAPAHPLTSPCVIVRCHISLCPNIPNIVSTSCQPEFYSDIKRMFSNLFILLFTDKLLLWLWILKVNLFFVTFLKHIIHFISLSILFINVYVKPCLYSRIVAFHCLACISSLPVFILFTSALLCDTQICFSCGLSVPEHGPMWMRLTVANDGPHGQGHDGLPLTYVDKAHNG